MSDSLSKEQRHVVAPDYRANAAGSASSPDADEWYDQGFDLADESRQEQAMLHDDGFGVNPALLDDAEEQFSAASKNRLRSDAEKQLKDGTVELHMDPLSPIREISQGSKQINAREGDIEVGGNGRIFDRANATHAHVQSEYLGPKPKPAEVKQVGTVYSPEYLAKKEREAQELAAAQQEAQDIAAAENSDFRTVVRRDKNFTVDDSRFLNAMREQQAERDAAKAAVSSGAVDTAAVEQKPSKLTAAERAARTAATVAASTYVGSKRAAVGGNLQAPSDYLGPKPKPVEIKQVGTVYSPEYLAKKEREAQELAKAQLEAQALAAAENSDYRTVVRREPNYSAEDSRFMQSLRDQQEDRDAQALGSSFGLSDAEAAAIAASDAADEAAMAQAERERANKITAAVAASTYKGSKLAPVGGNLQAASDYLGPKPKPVEVKQVGTVYSPEYLAQREREAQEAERARRELEAMRRAQSGDYRTVVQHEHGIADNQLVSSLRNDAALRDATEFVNKNFEMSDAEIAAMEAREAAKEAKAVAANLQGAQATDFGGEGSLLSRRSNMMASSDYLGPKVQNSGPKQVDTVYSPEYLAKKEREAKEREREQRAIEEQKAAIEQAQRKFDMTDDEIAAMEAREAAKDPSGKVVAANLQGAQATAFGGAGSLFAQRANNMAASDYLGPKAQSFGRMASSDYLGPKVQNSGSKQVGTVYSPEYLAQKEREAQAREAAQRELEAQREAENGDYRTLVRRAPSTSDADTRFMQSLREQQKDRDAQEQINRNFEMTDAEIAAMEARDAANLAAAQAAKGSTEFGGEGALLSRRANKMASSDYLGPKPQRAEVHQVGTVYSPEYLALMQEREALAPAQKQIDAQGSALDPNGDYRTRVSHSDNMSLEESRFLQSLRQAQSRQEADPSSAPATLAQSGGYSDLERQQMRQAQQSRLQQHQKAINERASIERQQAIAAQQERLRQMRQRQLQEQQARQRQALGQGQNAARQGAAGAAGAAANAAPELTGVAAAEARAAAQTMTYSEAIKDEYTTKGALELRKMREQELAQSPHPNKPKSNSEKTLEELAREYPGLSPEHLVKLKRSSNRCHLVSRTPIFDAKSNISMYELKFTAGKVFQVNALKSDHVYHVLFGYFIRRGISCFIGRNKSVLVMMPITYDFLDYIDRYSVNRVVLRICPEQPVTPSALHILTKLRRAGMSFAIDLMVLLKRDWNKAVLSIEYVMIDMSGKVKEQLSVFQRLKIKAPWLKTIGYNDVNGDGYAYLAKHMIDFLDAPFWNIGLQFTQDVEFFAPLQQEVTMLIHELFKEQPNYNIFQQFLRAHESLSRDMAVFLYRFRHASPRQVQNITELFHFLMDYSPDRSFSVMAGRTIMLAYVKGVNMSSQSILQEHYSQAIIRGYFVEYMSKIFDDPFVNRYAFQCGMFSLLHLFLLKEEVDVIADDQFADIFDRIYSESELMADIIECVQAIEATNLNAIFDFIHKYSVPPASVLISYEKALMRTNELLLVLNIVTSHK